MYSKRKVLILVLAQIILFALFCFFTVYAKKYDPEKYPPERTDDEAKKTNGEMSQGENASFRSASYSSSENVIFKTEQLKTGLVLLLFQCILCVLYVAFGEYTPHADASNPRNSFVPVYGGFNQDKNIIEEYYSLFQDVHVMIFIGFGFLMAFLKRYGYSSIGFTFLLGSFTVQWSILCQGFYNLNDDYKIELGIESIYRADIAAAAVLISMGVVLGRTSYIQLMIMAFIEIAAYSANLYLGTKIFRAADAGGSIFVHTFGAYFGLAVSYVINRKKDGNDETGSSLLESNYTSDLFAMLGTIFLWLFWPTFNAIDLKGDDQHRAIINTYLALASCCVSVFAASLIFNSERKFNMVHVQNATLAGGVAVGSAANLMLQPYGAIIIGIIAGSISVFGYSKVTPALERTCNIPDTCGVHNLHGMPGVLAALISGIMASLATESVYDKSLYEIYPARASRVPTYEPEYYPTAPGLGRSAGQQAGYQIVTLIVTLAVAVVSGLITGLVLRWLNIGPITPAFHYDDAISWITPERRFSAKKVSETRSHYDNPLFQVPESETELDGHQSILRLKSTSADSQGYIPQ